MKLLIYLLLFLSILSNLFSEKVTFEDVSLSRVLGEVGERYNVTFISDPSVELPVVSFMFQGNYEFSEILMEIQKKAAKRGFLIYLFGRI